MATLGGADAPRVRMIDGPRARPALIVARSTKPTRALVARFDRMPLALKTRRRAALLRGGSGGADRRTAAEEVWSS